jgi:hypothetical protein
VFRAFGKDWWIDEPIEVDQWATMKPNTPFGSLPILSLT